MSVPIPIQSRIPVPVLSRIPVPVLSRAPVPVLSRIPVPVLSRVPELLEYNKSIYGSQENFEKEMLKKQMSTFYIFRLIVNKFDEKDKSELSISPEIKQSRKRKRIVDQDDEDEDEKDEDEKDEDEKDEEEKDEEESKELLLSSKFPKQSNFSKRELVEKMFKILNKPIPSTEKLEKKYYKRNKEKKEKKFKLQKFTDEDVVKITNFTIEQIINMSIEDLKKNLKYGSDIYKFATYYIRRRWTTSKSYYKNKEKNTEN